MNKLMLDNFLVPGYGLTVSNSFQIATEDLSGKSSSTAVAENGFKPKSFSVSVTIRFKERDQLTRLTQVAESVGSNGQRTIYTAAHPLLAAMNVRRVRFSDTLTVNPENGRHAWNVSFTLKEYDSTAERMEARVSDPARAAQSGTGNAVVPGALAGGSSAAVAGNNTGESAQGAPALTDFEKVLQKLDSALGGGAA